MSSFTNPTSSGFDNLLLQTLMGRLQIRPPPQPSSGSHTANYPLLPQSLEDLLLQLSDVDDDEDNDDDEGEFSESGDQADARSRLAKEEAKLEKEIVRVILSGKTDSLKPNSGKAVTIGEHHICVGFHEEKGSDYRVWEWHGHIMLFDEENGYTPEYIYGNYFERLFGKVGNKGGAAKEEEQEEEEDEGEEQEEKVGNLGLRELIDGGDSSGGHILHRNISSSSPRLS